MDVKFEDPRLITVNVETASRLFGISRSSMFGLLAKKVIPSLMIAGRRVIRYGDLIDFANERSEARDLKSEERSARALKAARSKRRPSPTGKAH